ncbi:D-alanyl-D-alanine carboxypeptidase family protein [Senegalia massiliensis]|uniref:serine-type D-Ala-D-Ala carboxypeptidase n=1 Tax=Senegalia massiliensis TaxID=1720316 RepID=A0A845QWF5_9CLOT|nr:D-alanyl-D-alanine carboxypeptidase family protein [Senegalia massiliensis]NBI06611.1 D-alanyl-D-alanine carboxypeptidase [Senegalia massiliensis]
MIKKILNILVILFIIVSVLPFNIYAMEPFEVDGKAAILMDFKSGKVIYEKNPNKKLEPASITKIMVLILASEALESRKINLDDQVLISENAASMGGSQVYLEAGGTNTVEELFKAICLRSANDASVAMGEYIAGSEELFLEMMNKKAKQLNMKNTKFKNLTGLPDEEHLTTAYDIALMGRELLKHEIVHKWLSMWTTSIKVGKDRDVTQDLVNTNKLIRFYPGANGIKTGFTQKAGYCLAASATKDNTTFISVILGSKSSKIRNEDSKKLLDHGFSNYKSISLNKKGDIVDKISIEKGKKEYAKIRVKDDIDILMKKDNESDIKKEIKLLDTVKAPIKKGDKVGEIIVKSEGEILLKEELIIDTDIKKANILNILAKLFKNLTTK